MQNELPPKILYQYRPPEAWAFDNLRERVLYFGAPRNFNDPYDMGISLSVSGFTDEDFRNIAPNYPEGDAPEHKREELIARANETFEENQIYLRNLSGVACFCAENDNFPMWSHYAARGKGFCLGFGFAALNGLEGVQKFDGDAVIPVTYSEDMPDKHARKAAMNKLGFANFLAQKAKAWEYEQEWRMFKARAGGITYAQEALKCVCLGTEAGESTKEFVHAIVADTYTVSKPQLFQGFQSKTKFRVEFKDVPVRWDVKPR